MEQLSRTDQWHSWRFRSEFERIISQPLSSAGNQALLFPNAEASLLVTAFADHLGIKGAPRAFALSWESILVKPLNFHPTVYSEATALNSDFTLRYC